MNCLPDVPEFVSTRPETEERIFATQKQVDLNIVIRFSGSITWRGITDR